MPFTIFVISAENRDEDILSKVFQKYSTKLNKTSKLIAMIYKYFSLKIDIRILLKKKVCSSK